MADLRCDLTYAVRMPSTLLPLAGPSNESIVLAEGEPIPFNSLLLNKLAAFRCRFRSRLHPAIG